MKLKNNEQLNEVLRITQEECAEIIQAVSKILRFGEHSCHPNKSTTNIQHLEEEFGDLLAMLDILYKIDYVNMDKIFEHAEAKKEKIKKWSKIEVIE